MVMFLTNILIHSIIFTLFITGKFDNLISSSVKKNKMAQYIFNIKIALLIICV